MIYKFGKRSLQKLAHVDPRLKELCIDVLEISQIDFAIVHGYRTPEEQNELYKKGKSSKDGYIKKSMHQLKKAIDFVPIFEMKQRWDAWQSAAYIAGLFTAVAKSKNLRGRTGALWSSFKLIEENTKENNGILDSWHYEILD